MLPFNLNFHQRIIGVDYPFTHGFVLRIYAFAFYNIDTAYVQIVEIILQWTT